MNGGEQFVEQVKSLLEGLRPPDWRVIGSGAASPYSATVVVEWAGVRVKFLLDRYDYWIEVAAQSEPGEWFYLPYVLCSDESASDGLSFTVANDWDGLVRMTEELRGNLPTLQRFLASDAYEETKRRVAAIEQKLAQ